MALENALDFALLHRPNLDRLVLPVIHPSWSEADTDSTNGLGVASERGVACEGIVGWVDTPEPSRIANLLGVGAECHDRMIWQQVGEVNDLIAFGKVPRCGQLARRE
ncbi:hypothetical protein HYQ46_001386 [Verticillium longisporum]|nr:hypothetical protein HYQ46_001386 [Verticillium longisporum]